MCINPATHEGKTFACRKCWQCKENMIQDWVGRCIAQSKTSTASYYVTLTYGRVDNNPDHPRATILTYSDVQKYFKRLRAKGYKFKYLLAGEYGDLKSRCHWHVILFFEGKSPDALVTPPGEKGWIFNGHEEWPHGHTVWYKAHPANVRYCCKYMRKDVGDGKLQAKFMMSKVPPIGAEYFAEMALELVRRGNSPTNLKYSFNSNRNKAGKVVQHMMSGATARDFLQTFVDAWRVVHGEDNWPHAPLLRDFIDNPATEAERQRLAKNSELRNLMTLPYVEAERERAQEDDGSPSIYLDIRPEGTTLPEGATTRIRFRLKPYPEGSNKGELQWHESGTATWHRPGTEYYRLLTGIQLDREHRVQKFKEQILRINGDSRSALPPSTRRADYAPFPGVPYSKLSPAQRIRLKRFQQYLSGRAPMKGDS